ncbi:toxin HicA [Mycobacteroides chelonae]|uniref:toxin HicA n=1 Tax=Mycobacteroides chelonae TaxID=1774 RepID=UPI0019101F05|nr:toxin HicA [Mycobacteroides chelonae]QQG96199.1 toxin HicA [Mycobacteroides chelonae]
MVTKLEKTLAKMREKRGISYSDLYKVCEHYFGEPRQSGSHVVFKTPWPADPRVNIQNFDGQAKPYQIKQVLAAIDKLNQQKEETE